MRLWTVHPKYLDPQGLVALWRESLLALKVLRGRTKGYKHHPQLERFRNTPRPVAHIAEYLRGVLAEADARGYSFDRNKIPRTPRIRKRIAETKGQLAYEWRHLLAKLERRSPARYRELRRLRTPEHHPLFRIVEGPVAPSERQ